MGLTETDRKAHAYHEGGHAVVGTAMGFRVSEVTVKVRGRRAGATWLEAPPHGVFKAMPLLQRIDQCERLMVFFYAGPMAERCVRDPGPVDPDDQDAILMFKCVTAITADPMELRAHYVRAAERASTAVTHCFSMIDAVAAALLKEQTLTAARLEKVLEPYDVAGARAGLTAILF